MITATLLVAATLAAASVAVSSPLSTPFLLTTGPDIHKLASWTSNPIRTVVTVNSNRIDVLAAAEEDIPKVLEKLRELCAGPYANKYPEICEHLEDDDLWWPTAAPSLSSSILSSISILQSPSATPTQAEPTSSLATPSSSLVSENPVTSLPSASPAESSASIVTATTLITSSIYGSHLTTPLAETVECPYSTAKGEDGDTKPRCTVITIYHHLPIPTLITVTGPILSFPRNGAPGITLEAAKIKTRIRTTIVKTEVVTYLPLAVDDDQPPASTVELVQPTTPTPEVTIVVPVLEPEPSRPTTPRPTWSGYEPFPSISWFRSADPPAGCTQTESIFKKITDFQTATVYAETARATRVIGCECPNIKVVHVGGPEVVIAARTTVTLEEVVTETGFACLTTGVGVGG
ncbi:hypothetical protein B0T21DRAFT_381740 [Apiosordaria backusii]|uniref:Uncharacterized protein n=1 Tax=Apiosordaria backusii TaxID=314023 RepID=A0AA40EMB9_9PEZI|nr:hypothetical protein B0T21DRAFT_381740 [Apiosordaria backusii]